MGDSHTTVVRGLVAPFRGEQGEESITETSRKGRLGAPSRLPQGRWPSSGWEPILLIVKPSLLSDLSAWIVRERVALGRPRQECGPSMTSGNVSVWVFEMETGGSSPRVQPGERPL